MILRMLYIATHPNLSAKLSLLASRPVNRCNWFAVRKIKFYGDIQLVAVPDLYSVIVSATDR